MSYYNPNVYEEYILSKGRDLPTRTAAPKAQYPRTIGLRVFETEEEYQEALGDFLNGMWHSKNWHIRYLRFSLGALRLTSQPKTHTPMSYTVYITETSYTSAVFATKEEAESFMEEPDYDLCGSWEMSDSSIELVEDVTP